MKDTIHKNITVKKITREQLEYYSFDLYFNYYKCKDKHFQTSNNEYHGPNGTPIKVYNLVCF